MTEYVVWLDSNEAHIFALKSSGIEKSNLKKAGAKHHTNNKKDHHGADPATEHFYSDLGAKLKSASQILILGPGLAKTHFKTHLEKHHSDVVKKIVAVENSDHPTDHQVLATARNFFKSYNLYNQPVRSE